MQDSGEFEKIVKMPLKPGMQFRIGKTVLQFDNVGQMTADDDANFGAPAFGLYRQLQTPVATAELPNIVRVSVAFKAYPRRGGPNDQTSAAFSDQTTLRTADMARRVPHVC